ncbi:MULTISPECIES: hypothetical protein [unclassified Streptomyces]|uniref:hypothetical protein n=1 Tax=unclassified Streptomyces TaxID=2593676 RepID=UPI002E12E726|nr:MULTISPECIES: hypothetical protein [unclassified Streptomyces]WSR22200.1 hypothetical protein OG573_25750 [Streptomyces sp. NBC_01205]
MTGLPRASGMKTLNDALDIRRRIYRVFEMAETAADARERQRWLTFALVGGGPTGVELAGQIREIAGQGRPAAPDGCDRLACGPFHPRGLPHGIPLQAGSGAQPVRRFRHQLATRARLHLVRRRRAAKG